MLLRPFLKAGFNSGSALRLGFVCLWFPFIGNRLPSPFFCPPDKSPGRSSPRMACALDRPGGFPVLSVPPPHPEPRSRGLIRLVSYGFGVDSSQVSRVLEGAGGAAAAAAEQAGFLLEA